MIIGGPAEEDVYMITVYVHACVLLSSMIISWLLISPTDRGPQNKIFSLSVHGSFFFLFYPPSKLPSSKKHRFIQITHKQEIITFYAQINRTCYHHVWSPFFLITFWCIIFSLAPLHWRDHQWLAWVYLNSNPFGLRLFSGSFACISKKFWLGLRRFFFFWSSRRVESKK